MVKDDVQEVGVIKKKEGKVLKCQYNKNKSTFNQQTWLLFFLLIRLFKRHQSKNVYVSIEQDPTEMKSPMCYTFSIIFTLSCHHFDTTVYITKQH